MADYKAFDPRVESLVVETLTKWAPEVQGLTADEKGVIAKAIHARPQLATDLAYERTHTGFIREITVHEADIANLYASQIS